MADDLCSPLDLSWFVSNPGKSCASCRLHSSLRLLKVLESFSTTWLASKWLWQFAFCWGSSDTHVLCEKVRVKQKQSVPYNVFYNLYINLNPMFLGFQHKHMFLISKNPLFIPRTLGSDQKSACAMHEALLGSSSYPHLHQKEVACNQASKQLIKQSIHQTKVSRDHHITNPSKKHQKTGEIGPNPRSNG